MKSHKEIAEGLVRHGIACGWAGWDPYDGLASRWLEGDCPLCRRVSKFDLLDRPGRIALTQLCVRSPVNLRPILRVPKTVNPKALALFAMACMRLGRHDTAKELLARLAQIGPRGWGYPFPWQSRAFFANAGTPNAVVASFAGLAFLEGYERYRDPAHLQAALAGCAFIADGLPRVLHPEGVCIGYIPVRPAQVYNASLLAAQLLAEAPETGSWTRMARDAVRFVLSRQNMDGSWHYGEAGNQKWVDALHTCYILMSLKSLRGALQREAGEKDVLLDEIEAALANGWRVFRDRLCLPDGRIKFRLDSAYPWETHTAAAGILACVRLRNLDEQALPIAERIAARSIRDLYDPRTGLFAFRRNWWGTNRIDYLRWSQAWMALALSELANAS